MCCSPLKPPSKPLFRSGPFPNQRGKGQSPFKKSSQRREKTYQQRFTGEHSKKPLFQHANTTRLVANTETCPSFNKTHVSDKCSRYAFCRKNKTFSSKLAKTVRRPSHILNIVKGWEIPLLEEPVQLKEPHQIQMNNLESEATELEVDSMLKKGAIRIAIPKPEQILSNIFVRPKKREKISTNYKSKTDELLYSLPSFQDGGVEGCEEFSPKRRFSLQTGPERCLLFNSSEYKIPKVCTVPVEREPLRVSVPSIWIGSQPQEFLQN